MAISCKDAPYYGDCDEITDIAHHKSDKAHMNEGRYSLVSEYYDGKIYSIGGFDGIRNKKESTEPFSTTFETYNLQKSQWEVIGALPESQQGATSELFEGKVYIFGGYYCQSTFQVLDLETNCIERKDQMPNPTYWGTSELLDGVIYFFGGRCERGNHDEMLRVQTYEILFDNWNTKDPIPKVMVDSISDFQRVSSVLHNDKIYVWSAYDMLSYNPEDKYWEKIENIPHLKFYQEAVSYKNAILFSGGSVESPRSSATSKDFYAYFPETKEWRTYPNMTNFKRQYNYGFLNIRDTLYLFGGREYQSWDALDNVEIYENFEL